MLLADTMAIFFVILGLMIAFPSFWLLCRGLWPNATSGAATTCSHGLVKAFGVGLAVTTLVTLVAIGLGRALGPPGRITAAGLVSFYVVIASIGVAGFATMIGERLRSPIDNERPWRATLRGGIVLELTYLLPVLGWFIIFPASLIVGSGAATLSFVAKRRTRTSAAPAEPVETAI